MSLAALVVLATVIVAVPAHGFLGRAAAASGTPGTDPMSVPTVIGWLDQQPSWVTGDRPVGAGQAVDAYLAGPTFSHRLFLIGQNTPCAQVRRLQAADWLVLPAPVKPTAAALSYVTYNRSTCLHSLPAFSGAGYLIYRPQDLTTAAAP